MPTVLFVCVRNAGRSQIAEAFLRAHGGDAFDARSAGSAPAHRVHPEVVEAMQERGIDLSQATPTKLTADLAAESDVVVTMGCGDACPVLPGQRVIDWELDDPGEQPLGTVRRIRDEIERRVLALRDELLSQTVVDVRDAR